MSIDEFFDGVETVGTWLITGLLFLAPILIVTWIVLSWE